MAVMRLVALIALSIALRPCVLAAQTPALISELDVTIGRSTEGVQAAGAQIRLFGEGPKEWRFFAEASWADVWGPPLMPLARPIPTTIDSVPWRSTPRRPCAPSASSPACVWAGSGRRLESTAGAIMATLAFFARR